ncbi:hypothetical protein ACFVUW_18585 [Streptomyces xiamenensis]|uniref:hypothetical protein n=1 Tax=Streptomyces xiamenensis TaxID=408015 RepID=UPI0036EC3BE2
MPVRRDRLRRAGERAFGALLLTRMILMTLLALLMVTGGAWSSWDTARDALRSPEGAAGPLTLRECDRERCTGTFGSSGETVALYQRIGREPGETLEVALRPGTAEVVRTGAPGVLYACLPLAGSLLLAGIVIAGGLRMYRTAWATAGAGIALLAAAFALW